MGFGKTTAALGKSAQELMPVKPCREASKKHVPVQVKSHPTEHFRPIPKWIEHDYTSPLVSGYTGFFPGKKAENLIGGGIPKTAADARQIFDAREAAAGNRANKGLWAEMDAYYDRRRKKAE